MAKQDIYVATSSFVATVDGRRCYVHAEKTRVREGHPLMKGREHLFKPIDVQYDVEQATAAPAEKRGRGRPRQQPRNDDGESVRDASAGDGDSDDDASGDAR